MKIFPFKKISENFWKIRKILKTIRKNIAEPPFSKDSIPPDKISSKSVENWRRKVCNSIFRDAIQRMIYLKLLQTFLRQFSTELNGISCAYIKCNEEGGSGRFFQTFLKFSKHGMIMLQIVQSKFLFQQPVRNGATSRLLFKLLSVPALRKAIYTKTTENV